MRSIEQLISDLNDLNVKVWADGDHLRLNSPKGVLTAELKDELSARKPELLTFLRSAQSVSQPVISPIKPAARAEVLPLSYSQQRLWFLDRFEPGNVAYNLPMTVRLNGSLDVNALQRALNEIVSRHEALRTTFPIINGRPVQEVAPSALVPLPVVDLQGLPESEREEEARRLCVEEAKSPFDLARGPVFRARLLQLATDDFFLLISKHHIVSDGWSLGVFFQELQTLYQAFLSGHLSPLPDLPLQYADFAIWQREWLQGPILKRQLDYWKKQLGGSLPILDLPLDHPRPAMQTFRGNAENSIFPTSLRDKLKALSQAEGSTLFMTLLAAFKVLLARYSGQQDILVGTPVANRNRVEFEQLIGLFVNTLVLRTDLSGNPSFRELLDRIRETALEAYAHQDVPFELLVEALHPERDPSHPPLFQTMFILQNAPLKMIKLPGLTLHPLEEREKDKEIGGTAKFDLTLIAWELPPGFGNYPEGLGVTFEYNTDLFEQATVVRMLKHFKKLLEEIVANPDRPIFELPFLSDAERKQLLVDWNATQADYPREQTVFQLFEAQAIRTPNAEAIHCGDECITYEVLNQRANQLAYHLQALGVGPEDFVGIYMQRSIEMIVALLAILKAGGAYVPLDPSFPRDRLAYMIEDCQAKVLLTQQHLLADAPHHQTKVVCIDSDWPEISKHDSQNFFSGVKPHNLAYVIYTSGSTGKPKGVQIPHRAVVNFLTSMRQKPGLTAGDRLLSVTTLSFDISVLEVFLPLTTGACVVVVPGEAIYDGAALIQYLSTNDITVMQATPATWQMLIDAGWQGDKNLKVLCGGETLPRDLAKWLSGHVGSVWNMYGPTETTVWSTICEITDETELITIGRPIANTQIYILDQNLEPTPIGVAGELYIAGDGVARGYLKQPELTAEKFLPDPFRNQSGARMYKTGDQARYLADGQIDFLGRTDFEVKVRGFRIELGEIETILNSHAAIRQAVVVAREDSPDDKRLVAYLISETDHPPEPGELRRFIRMKLPEYMVPSSFVFLDEFPMTPNRKVNRKALPAPDTNQLKTERTLVLPRTPTEEKIARIWASVLRLEKLDIHDNFFDLGGHSLLATRVISFIREQFNIDLPLRILFLTPTIVEISEAVDTILWATRQDSSTQNRRTGNKDEMEI